MSKLYVFFLPHRDGYNMWRDAFKPTQILDSLCKKTSLPAAEYRQEEVKVGSKIFKVPPEAFPEGTEAMATPVLGGELGWEPNPTASLP